MESARDPDYLTPMAKPGSCKTCGVAFGLFRWRHPCTSCGGTHCASCVESVPAAASAWGSPPYPPGDHCGSCMNSIVEPALERLARATSAVSSLDTWPATYQGRVPVDADRSTADLSSGRFRERSAALEELKLPRDTCRVRYCLPRTVRRAFVDRDRVPRNTTGRLVDHIKPPRHSMGRIGRRRPSESPREANWCGWLPHRLTECT